MREAEKSMEASSKRILSPSELTLQDGATLVRLARRAIEEFARAGKVVELPHDIDPKLMRPGMAFVTIERVSREGVKELRGCIGFLQPTAPLAEVVVRAAVAAASEDPRFPPLRASELDSVVVEVSVLSPPTPVKDRKRDVAIGKHGIIIVRGWHSGTLLPQVPVEYCWDSETFLAEGCLKAGLDPDCWLDPQTKIFVYEGAIFYEERPRGVVKQRNLEEEYRTQCSARSEALGGGP